MTAISPVSVIEPEFDTAFPFDDQYECVREAEKHVVFCRNPKQQRRKEIPEALRRRESTDSSNDSVCSCGSSNTNPREEFEITLTPTSSRLKAKLSTRISQMKRITLLKRSLQKGDRRQSKERPRPVSSKEKDEQNSLLPTEILQPDYPLTRIEKAQTYDETLKVKKSSSSGEVPLSRVRSVSFAEKLVTEVRTTPFVLPQDKPRFFYSPSEIRMFKIDFRYRLQNGFAAYDDIWEDDGGHCFCVSCPC